ncbi:MAG TPA: DUF885 family protein, partial [Acidimicrobiales bacterium]|nr:DUF885 family protein [Acidimicrobiales bacterium]
MADVDAFFERWLAEEVAERPVLASRLGLDGYDDQLGDLTAAGFHRREEADMRWASRLTALGRGGLTPEQDIDVDLLHGELAGRAVTADWAAWRRDPNVYLAPCLSGVFTLFLDRLHPEPDLARFAAARLRQVPAALEAGQANLDANLASPVIVER